MKKERVKKRNSMIDATVANKQKIQYIYPDETHFGKIF